MHKIQYIIHNLIHNLSNKYKHVLNNIYVIYIRNLIFILRKFILFFGREMDVNNLQNFDW